MDGDVDVHVQWTAASAIPKWSEVPALCETLAKAQR